MAKHEFLLQCFSRGPEETEALGAALGRLLQIGEGVALRGELGAGKTVFVRGLAQGLEVDEPGEVRSPTYLLMVEHPGPIPLLHLDAYFAKRGNDFLADGGQAYLSEAGVVAIEWAEKLSAQLPEDFLVIELEHCSEEQRRLRIMGQRERWGQRIRQIADES
ncbi:MAG: tRNA (adenosine(37)-N6)-threonylcarbamoyltransferase complex ATPase subunit type 1 TsaE [Planctomycetota bacterium]|nr:MAG: tRNA (adenosine(37)-N6)-threonylcarbamoyltransferase complex ATPase subunit type 1 TsaE [Planctomycetota bacterium]